MIHVQFENALGLGRLLPGRLEQLLHVGAHIPGIAGEAGHRILEPRGRLDLLDLRFQLSLDEAEQGIVGFLLGVVHGLQPEIALFGALERFAVVFGEGLDHPFIHRVGHQEHFVVFLFELLQVRAVEQGGELLAGDVVNLLLVRLHVLHVIVQGNPFILGFGGFVTRQGGELLFVGRVGVNPLLEDGAEFVVELVVFVGIHLFQKIEELLEQVLADVDHQAVLLQDLAADVEIEVRRIHHPFDETEIFRHQLLAVVHDEHAFGVEVDAVTPFGREKVEGGLGGDVEQGAVLGGAFELEVQPLHGRVPVVAEMFVELFVLFVGHLAGIAGPDRLHGIEGLFTHHLACGGTDGLSILVLDNLLIGQRFVALDLHGDRVADEIRVLLDDVADHPLVGEVLVVLFLFLQFQGDGRSPAGLLGGLDAVGAVAAGDPFDRFVGRRTGRPGDEGDRVGHHEGAVEADPELPDQFRDQRCLALGVFQGFHEGGGPAFGDGADVFQHFVMGHTDAVVGDFKGLFDAIGFEMDLELGIVAQQPRFRLGPVADLVDGIRCIGNQLPQKDIFIGVKGVDDQVEHLLHFGLELVGLLLCFHERSSTGLKLSF